MAERRGLFGDTNPKKGKQKVQTKTLKKDDKLKITNKIKRKKFEDVSVLVRTFICFVTLCSFLIYLEFYFSLIEFHNLLMHP